MRVWRLQRATAMEHRIAGQRVRQVKNRSATDCIIAADLKNTISKELKVDLGV